MIKVYLLKEFEDLKEYGLTKEPQGVCYELKLETYNIFIWNRKDNIDYEYKRVYIEFKDHNMILEDFYTLYTMIIRGVIGYE